MMKMRIQAKIQPTGMARSPAVPPIRPRFQQGKLPKLAHGHSGGPQHPQLARPLKLHAHQCAKHANESNDNGEQLQGRGNGEGPVEYIQRVGADSPI